MGTWWRLGLGIALLVAAGALFVLLRPGDDGSGAAGSGGSKPARFEVSVGEDGPDGVEQLRVRQGQRVELSVTMAYESDVHLHGYDIMRSTGPGEPPAEFDFVADTPGRFDLEAHEGWQTIAQLLVEP